MKFKADGWLFLFAVLAIAGALFVPLRTPDASLSVLRQLNPLAFIPVMAWFLAAAVFWGFINRFWQGDARERGRLSNGVLLLVLQAILLRTVFDLSVAYDPPWPWFPPEAWAWFPWFLVPALTAILLGGRFGILTCLAGTLMLYLIADPGPWPLVGCMSSAVVGVLLLRRSPTRSRVLRAGIGAGCMLGMVAASQYAMQGTSLDALSAAFFVPLTSGIFSAFLVLAVLPVLEWMLGELSDVSLIEYGTDHPLLDQLRTEAPGTWHHSLNVADLAEKAASAVGARALFCKTAALYHDIGKLKDPSYFTENNADPSPHNELDPRASARKIIEHVSHGLELARKHRLPSAFRDVIAEHHGISIVRFFYAKACQPLPDGTQPIVDRACFTYPGPPPATRESGIIALADAVEAASRSLPSRSEPDLRIFIRRLLAERIAEGELAKCPLTLSDLAGIEAAFIAWLKGRNQYRPAYPETSTDTEHLLARPEARSARQPA